MYKYVGVYILVLMHNSFSMCYLGNTIEIKRNFNLKKKKNTFCEKKNCNEMDAIFLHMY
jgi:hypothetical protein